MNNKLGEPVAINLRDEELHVHRVYDNITKFLKFLLMEENYSHPYSAISSLSNFFKFSLSARSLWNQDHKGTNHVALMSLYIRSACHFYADCSMNYCIMGHYIAAYNRGLMRDH